jgi:hypothetical protein
MDFRVITDYLEERRRDKKSFILHYARISKEGELLCNQFKMCIKDDYGWPMLEFINKDEAKKSGYISIRISSSRDNGITKKLDCQPRAIGRTKEEALQCLKNSLQLKIELRKKDIEKAKSIIENSEKELNMIDNVLETE